MKNDLNIQSLITRYDPHTVGRYKVCYSVGKNQQKKYNQTTVISAINRYHAIKQLKQVSPLFMCNEVEFVGGIE
jgi:hypothetical protein